MSSDPYAGIELPTPPKGYRLARWGETITDDCLWWGRLSEEWMAPLFEYSFYHEANPQSSIFAIPKPRVRIPLEVSQ